MSVLCQYCGVKTKDELLIAGWSTCQLCQSRIDNGESAPPYIWVKTWHTDKEMEWNYQKPKEIKNIWY